jgi:hypothetical protein
VRDPGHGARSRTGGESGGGDDRAGHRARCPQSRGRPVRERRVPSDR